MCVVAYKFIPKKIYQLPNKGAINLHASLLPKYRGAAPIQYSLLNGDNKTGLTTFYLNDAIDRFNGVSTKYLQNYLNCFLILERLKNTTMRIFK